MNDKCTFVSPNSFLNYWLISINLGMSCHQFLWKLHGVKIFVNPHLPHYPFTTEKYLHIFRLLNTVTFYSGWNLVQTIADGVFLAVYFEVAITQFQRTLSLFLIRLPRINLKIVVTIYTCRNKFSNQHCNDLIYDCTGQGLRVPCQSWISTALTPESHFHP